MPLKVTDKFIAPSRGSVADVLRFFETNPPARRRESEIITQRVYALCSASGMDFSLAMARIADETGSLNGPSFFVSEIYRERLNIGGLGVTDGVDEMLTFTDPIEAADAYMAHLFTYVLGDDYEFLEDVTPLADPRFDATPVAWRGSVKTLDDLRGKWFTNPDGAINSAARGNRIFPGIEDQQSGGSPVALQIDQRLTTRDLGFFTTDELWITIHNNGNPSSDRFDEAAFVEGGGGSQGVLYHGAIDAGGFCQIEKFDRKGIHAGNAQGNATSIGFEMCEGSEPWGQVKENTAQLLAAIVTGDPRLDFGVRSKDNFSLDRVREHRDWPGANPNCPRRLIQTDGGVEKIVARAREIVGGTTPKPSKYPKPITDWMTGKDKGLRLKVGGEDTNVKVYALERDYEAIKRTYRYQGPDTKGPKVGDRLNVRERFTGAYVAKVGNSWWVVSPAGSWFLMSALTPRVSVQAA